MDRYIKMRIIDISNMCISAESENIYMYNIGLLYGYLGSLSDSNVISYRSRCLIERHLDKKIWYWRIRRVNNG